MVVLVSITTTIYKMASTNNAWCEPSNIGGAQCAQSVEHAQESEVSLFDFS